MSDVHSAIGALAAGGGVAPGTNMYLLAEVREIGLTDDELCRVIQLGYDSVRQAKPERELPERVFTADSPVSISLLRDVLSEIDVRAFIRRGREQTR